MDLFILSKGPKALMSPWCPIFHQAPPQNTTIVFLLKDVSSASIVLTDAAVFSVSSVRIGTSPPREQSSRELADQ